jgi:Fe-S cluster assembly scaffold protein SufB
VVRYLSLQHFGAGVRHFSMQHVNTGRDSTLNVCNVTLGADLARCDVSSHLLGPGSDSEMLALWFGDRRQHFDHHTLQNHAAPHARSDLLFKGALAGEAKSVFRGMIRVAKHAQLTDAYQTNRNLLLSDDAEAVTLPSLEIEADDVKCSHGATVGQVDEAQLFYLMSRGLTRGGLNHKIVMVSGNPITSGESESTVGQLRQAIASALGHVDGNAAVAIPPRATASAPSYVESVEKSESALRAAARIKGYEGESCGDCGNFTLVRNGTCLKCDTCGSTSGCS